MFCGDAPPLDVLDFGYLLWHWFCFLQDPPNGCHSKMQTSPSQELSDANLSHSGEECLQLPYEIAHEVRGLVDGFGDLNQRVRILLVNSPHPGPQCLLVHEKGLRCLLI
jgi:hypothetical protein